MTTCFFCKSSTTTTSKASSLSAQQLTQSNVKLIFNKIFNLHQQQPQQCYDYDAVITCFPCTTKLIQLIQFHNDLVQIELKIQKLRDELILNVIQCSTTKGHQDQDGGDELKSCLIKEWSTRIQPSAATSRPASNKPGPLSKKMKSSSIKTDMTTAAEAKPKPGPLSKKRKLEEIQQKPSTSIESVPEETKKKSRPAKSTGTGTPTNILNKEQTLMTLGSMMAKTIIKKKKESSLPLSASANTNSKSQPAAAKSSAEPRVIIVDSDDNSSNDEEEEDEEEEDDADVCKICYKVCHSVAKVKIHMKKVHGIQDVSKPAATAVAGATDKPKNTHDKVATSASTSTPTSKADQLNDNKFESRLSFSGSGYEQPKFADTKSTKKTPRKNSTDNKKNEKPQSQPQLVAAPADKMGLKIKKSKLAELLRLKLKICLNREILSDDIEVEIIESDSEVLAEVKSQKPRPTPRPGPASQKLRSAGAGPRSKSQQSRTSAPAAAAAGPKSQKHKPLAGPKSRKVRAGLVDASAIVEAMMTAGLISSTESRSPSVPDPMSPSGLSEPPTSPEQPPSGPSLPKSATANNAVSQQPTSYWSDPKAILNSSPLSAGSSILGEPRPLIQPHHRLQPRPDDTGSLCKPKPKSRKPTAQIQKINQLAKNLKATGIFQKFTPEQQFDPSEVAVPLGKSQSRLRTGNINELYQRMQAEAEEGVVEDEDEEEDEEYDPRMFVEVGTAEVEVEEHDERRVLGGMISQDNTATATDNGNGNGGFPPFVIKSVVSVQPIRRGSEDAFQPIRTPIVHQRQPNSSASAKQIIIPPSPTRPTTTRLPDGIKLVDINGIINKKLDEDQQQQAVVEEDEEESCPIRIRNIQSLVENPDEDDDIEILEPQRQRQPQPQTMPLSRQQQGQGESTAFYQHLISKVTNTSSSGGGGIPGYQHLQHQQQRNAGSVIIGQARYQEHRRQTHVQQQQQQQQQASLGPTRYTGIDAEQIPRSSPMSAPYINSYVEKIRTGQPIDNFQQHQPMPTTDHHVWTPSMMRRTTTPAPTVSPGPSRTFAPILTYKEAQILRNVGLTAPAPVVGRQHAAQLQQQQPQSLSLNHHNLGLQRRRLSASGLAGYPQPPTAPQEEEEINLDFLNGI